MEKEQMNVKFKHVSEEIDRRIHDGIYVSSQKLPSEYDLAKEFSVSRLTVRKAIDDLIAQNILVKRKGKGSYVMSQQKIQSGRAGLQGFTEAAKAYGKTSKTNVLSFKQLTAVSPEILVALEVEDPCERTICELIRLRSLDDEPMTVEKIYIFEEFIPSATRSELSKSLFGLIEKTIEIAYSHQEVEAILVEQEMSELLEVPVGAPLLQVHSSTYAIDGTPILYDVSYYRADKYTFKNTLTRYSH